MHVDESGDLHFTRRGSRYYVFTAAWTYDPAPLAHDLAALRFRLLKGGAAKSGQDLGAFHACEDPQLRRDDVVNCLRAHGGWNFASIVVDKPCVNPSIRDEHTFYPKFASMVLRFVLRGRVLRSTGRVLIYTDTLPMTGKRRDAVELAIKQACRAELPIPFECFHHRRESNMWIQVADYCCWGVYRKWESGDTRTYELLRGRLAAPELAPMARGDGTNYY